MSRAAALLLVCLLASSACDRAGSPSSTTSTPTSAPLRTSAPASPSESPRSGRLELAFACGRSICLSLPDGRSRRVVTRGPGARDRDPSWSPDGKRIVFSGTVSRGNADLFVIDADGTGLRQITSDPSSETQPEWSPDGARIAFTTDRDGNQEVYVMNVDGSHLVDLSRNPARDFGPTWSPDGKRIAFTSTRDRKPEVYVVEADGSRTTRLTISEGSSSPTWSPEGLRIVLVAVGIGLALVDLRSGTVSPITTDGTDAHPRWSPSGDLIVFDRGPVKRPEIFTVKPDGKGLRQVTRDPGGAGDPAWGLALA
jgi:TolB protein